MNDETSTEVDPNEAVYARIREIVREELDVFLDSVARLLTEHAASTTPPAWALGAKLPAEGPSVGDATTELVDRVMGVFRGAKNEDQGQAVTYLSKHLDERPKDILAALRALEERGDIYSRPHMRSFMYYLVGRGPGPGTRAKKR